MRARWAVALTAAMTAAVVTSGGVAWATDPVELGSSHIADSAGALDTVQEAQAEQRIQQLKDDTGLDLWVVYVDEFTNPSSAEDWANSTAELNGLGPSQYLLAVAVGSRQYYLSADSAGL